jgi:hypothetical protein
MTISSKVNPAPRREWQGGVVSFMKSNNISSGGSLTGMKTPSDPKFVRKFRRSYPRDQKGSASRQERSQ